MNKTYRIRRLLQEIAVSLSMLALATPGFGSSPRIDGNLILVPKDKLPPQARVEGDAMTLHLVDLQTLYLYIERDHGQNLAVFDVRNPAKIKFKRMVPINAPASFDFCGLVAPYSMLIRYRDGSGEAILDLMDARKPQIRPLSDTPAETFILPVSDAPITGLRKTVPDAVAPRDYQIVLPNGQRPLIRIKGVIQQANDTGNETTYLLGADGLTVIRNIRGERNLAALAPPWTNTIDDK